MPDMGTKARYIIFTVNHSGTHTYTQISSSSEDAIA